MSIFNSLKPQGGQKLRPFDLSRRDCFSVKSGVLNVNFVQHTLPESKYEVNHAQITRVDAIQTAPFARMSENYEYYFVPYSQIFHDFERLYYERGEQQRNYENADFSSEASMSLYVPTFDYSEVVEKLMRWFYCSRLYLKAHEQFPEAAENRLSAFYDTQDLSRLDSNGYFPLDIHGEICVDEMIKLFDNLGYGNIYPICNSMLQSLFDWQVPLIVSVDKDIDKIAYINVANLQFAQSLVSCFNSTTFTESSSSAVHTFSFNGIYEHYCEDLFNVFSLMLDDSVNIVPVWYDNFDAFVFMVNLMADVFDNEDFEFAYVSSYLQDIGTADWRPSIIALAAYQKVFSDIYRNTQFDTAFYASLFNFDYIVDSGDSIVGSNRVLGALMPRFRQYKKDMFTGVFPNAQFGSVAVSGLNDNFVLQATNNPSGSIMTSKGSLFDGKIVRTTASSASGASSTNSTVLTWKADAGISALAIRQALSLQRYKERILRAGNRITALQNAVFGDKSRFIEDEYVQFIGAERNNIDFNAVAATSDAGNSEVGQLGSNGVGTHVGKAFEFHSHDFGIILGIYYILPESEYESFMIDPMNTKSETNDFYKPDFMNLGLSPVYNYQFNSVGYDGIDGDSVLGYLANYWEYKTAIDKVHGSFYGSLPQKSRIGMLGPSLGLPDVSNIRSYYRGQNAYYVTPRSSQSFRQNLTLGNLYVNPHDIDPIFYVNSNFTLITDQFKVNCNHDVKALLPMSVIGLPDY